MSAQPQTTTESATNRIDLVALAAELDAAGIPVVPWGHYLHIATLDGIDVYQDGAVYVGTTRIEAGTLTPLSIIAHHATPAPTVREQPEQDLTYLLAVIEHSAQLEARGELNDRQRQYWSECRAALLRQMGGDTGGQG